jgi:hypothetical protein
MEHCKGHSHGQGSWGTVVGIAAGYGLEDRGVEFESWKGQELSLLYMIQALRRYPTTCLKGLSKTMEPLDSKPPIRQLQNLMNVKQEL